MTTRYRLEQVPVEHVNCGNSLAIRTDDGYRLFQVQRMQMSYQRGGPVTFTLTSEPINGGDPWVIEYAAGTPLVRMWLMYEAAS